MSESREQLVEWVEANWYRIPDHIRVIRTFALPIKDQETHVLRMIKEHTESFAK